MKGGGKGKHRKGKDGKGQGQSVQSKADDGKATKGKKSGEKVEWGGLWGTAIVQDTGSFGASVLHKRGGRIPAPLQGYKN